MTWGTVLLGRYDIQQTGNGQILITSLEVSLFNLSSDLDIGTQLCFSHWLNNA